jgi:hypothetical protein
MWSCKKKKKITKFCHTIIGRCNWVIECFVFIILFYKNHSKFHRKFKEKKYNKKIKKQCIPFIKMCYNKMTSGKSLRLKSLLSLWSQVRVMWLLIWWLLEAYMVVNFRVCGISRGTRKQIRTSTLKKYIL